MSSVTTSCRLLSSVLSPQSVIQCPLSSPLVDFCHLYSHPRVSSNVLCHHLLQTSVISTLSSECHPMSSVITSCRLLSSLLSPQSVIQCPLSSHPYRLLSSLLSVQSVIKCPLSSPPVDFCHLYSQFRVSSNVLCHHLL